MWAIGGQLVDLVSHFLERNSRSKVHTNVLKQRTYKCVKKPAKGISYKIFTNPKKCKMFSIQKWNSINEVQSTDCSKEPLSRLLLSPSIFILVKQNVEHTTIQRATEVGGEFLNEREHLDLTKR